MALDKVVDSAELDAGMTLIADAIREKTGTADPLMWPDGFSEAIAGILSGNASIEPAFRATVTVDEEQTASVSNLFVIESTFAADLNLEDNSAGAAFNLSSKRQRILAMQVKRKTSPEKLASVAIGNTVAMIYFYNGAYYLRGISFLALYKTNAENNLFSTYNGTAQYGLRVEAITPTSINLGYFYSSSVSAQLEVGDYEVLIYDLGGIDFVS